MTRLLKNDENLRFTFVGSFAFVFCKFNRLLYTFTKTGPSLYTAAGREHKLSSRLSIIIMG